MLKALFLALALLILYPFIAEAKSHIVTDIQYCAREATQIVVVTEGDKIDGKVTILASWKGDLIPATRLAIPELAKFKSQVSRHIECFDTGLDWNKCPEGTPKFVTGSKIVLFLAKQGSKNWSAIGAVWIEQRIAYGLWDGNKSWEGTLASIGSEKEIEAIVAKQQAVPVAKEPRHITKFKNQYVRVIDASVTVGDATLFHTHDLDNVPVNVSGGKLKTETVGQAEPTLTTMETGRTSFAKGGYTHRISNTGDTLLRFIDAEILGPYGKASAEAIRNGALDSVTGHSLIVENERVRVYRIIIEPGQEISAHAHLLPRLSVSVSGGKVSETTIRQSQTRKLKVGDFRWHAPESRHLLKNLGTQRYEAVEIEWK
jgi:quercetin dioxygenase-like cupin family protein